MPPGGGPVTAELAADPLPRHPGGTRQDELALLNTDPGDPVEGLLQPGDRCGRGQIRIGSASMQAISRRLRAMSGQQLK